jgi:SAM-dependent methyltransferase
MATTTRANQARRGEVRHPLFAALYDRLTAALERDVLGPRRAALLGELEGQVLDVGAGTGANLAHFHRAGRVVATEPDPAMRRRMARKLGRPSPRRPTEASPPPRMGTSAMTTCPGCGAPAGGAGRADAPLRPLLAHVLGALAGLATEPRRSLGRG